MKTEEIKEILSKVRFAPSNLDMGWKWDVKPTKIMDDDGILIEKGFSIRTTFMRPDANSGEVEKGYGRWMYVPENVSTDGLVKTAWVCAELIIKHELMEAFLYDSNRIFDPHKSLEELSYNSRKVETSNDNNIDVDNTSSADKFKEQNYDAHLSDVMGYLGEIFGKYKATGEGVFEFSSVSWDKIIFIKKEGAILSNINGKILEVIESDDLDLSSIKALVNKYYDTRPDAAEVNLILSENGFNEVKKMTNGNITIFTFHHKDLKQYISHFEDGKIISRVSPSNNLIDTLENEEYTLENIREMISNMV